MSPAFGPPPIWPHDHTLERVARAQRRADPGMGGGQFESVQRVTPRPRGRVVPAKASGGVLAVSAFYAATAKTFTHNTLDWVDFEFWFADAASASYFDWDPGTDPTLITMLQDVFVWHSAHTFWDNPNTTGHRFSYDWTQAYVKSEVPVSEPTSALHHVEQHYSNYLTAGQHAKLGAAQTSGGNLDLKSGQLVLMVMSTEAMGYV